MNEISLGQERVLRLLSAPQIAEKLGVSCPTVYAFAKKPDFPKARCLTSTTKRWLSSEIDEWMQQLPTYNKA